MPPLSDDKKNSLQSVVDNIQTQATKTAGTSAGYTPNPDLKSLRTFQGDMQEHIEVKKETVATIALAEQKKKIEHNEPTYTERPSHSGRSGLFIVMGIICLLCGGIIFGALYFLRTETTQINKVMVEKTIIPYTTQKEIPLQTLDSTTLAASLLQEQTSFKAELNNVLRTTLTHESTPLTLTELLSLIAPHAGDALKRNLVDSMVGVFSYDTNELFFIFKPDDFGIVYSGMLDWESTLGGDFSLFFPGLRQHLATHASVFSDETFKNKDVRVIRNDAGNIVFMYGFIDKETLVITTNEKIFEAILAKYNQNKLSR